MKAGMNNCWESAAHSAGVHLVGSSRPCRSFPLRTFCVCGTFRLKSLPLKAGGEAGVSPARPGASLGSGRRPRRAVLETFPNAEQRLRSAQTFLNWWKMSRKLCLCRKRPSFL